MAVRALRRSLLAVVLLVGAVQSRAQVQPIPPFVGAVSETFESQVSHLSLCIPARVFSNQADLCTPSGPNCNVSNGAGLSGCACPPACQIGPHTGAKLFSTTYGVWEVTFDTAVLRFGGWFDAFVNNANTTFHFFDVNGEEVASDTPPIPFGCQWAWFGWDLSSGPPIKRVFAEMGGSTGYSFFLVDDLQADLAPSAPTVYCTAGVTTHSCAASISASANPKLSHTTPCQITVAGVEGQKVGVIYYGLTKQLVPWCTGGLGTSVLCIKPPILATTPQNAGGASGLCNGTLHLDWSAYQLAHPSALGNPWTASAKVYAQAWFRDPPACRSMNLSNAVELTYQP